MSRKTNKRKRKKRLAKQIKGQVKQQEKHLEKIEKKIFRKDTTEGYYLEEMKRVLKPEGEILISVFNEEMNTFYERIKFYTELKAPVKEVKGTTVIFDYPHGANISEQFSKKQLENIFQKNNLHPIEISKQGIGYFCRLKKS